MSKDGNIIQETSEKNRDELVKAIRKYTANMESQAQKLKMAKLSHDETDTRLQKSVAAAKSIQKTYSLTSNLLKKKQAIASMVAGTKMKGKQTETVEIDRAAARVDDIIGSIHDLADKRRHNAEESRTASFRDKWMESLPELSSVVKDSLFLRMQRRSKYHIILRPTPETLVNSLRAGVDAAAMKWPVGKNSVEKAAAIESAVEKAEQLFLLATHPLASGDEASVPTSSSENRWAEPGCLLDLSVPDGSRNFNIIPRQPTFPIFERNLAEFSSSYGRQCASLTNPSFLRSFNAPLSYLAVAGSIAEAEPSVSSIRKFHHSTIRLLTQILFQDVMRMMILFSRTTNWLISGILSTKRKRDRRRQQRRSLPISLALSHLTQQSERRHQNLQRNNHLRKRRKR
jgi:hypothetical protein